MNVSELRDASELALAAYGQFERIDAPEADRLTNLNGDDAGFAEDQASRFRGWFNVAVPTFNDASSPGGSGGTSFDATVFIGKDSTAGTGNHNEIHIAFRGTQQLTGSPNDRGIGASLGILSDGAAIEQIIAMHNWYVLGRGWGIDTVQESDATASVIDKVLFGAGIVKADTTFARNGNNLEVRIAGTTDKLVVANWYLGSQYQVELFQYADGTSTTSSQVAGLLSAMAMFGRQGSALSTSTGFMQNAQWKRPDYLVAQD